VRVLLSTYGSRGDVEPLVGLAVRLRALDAEVPVCAPPDKEFAELLAGVGVPLVPLGQLMRSMVRPSSAADSSRRSAELIAAQFDTLAAAAEGCDVLVATGMVHFAARSVTDKLGIRYVYATFCPINLPSPHHPAAPGPAVPTGGDRQPGAVGPGRPEPERAVGPGDQHHRASIDLPPVDNVLEHMFTDHPWLATDPTLGPWHEPADLDVVTTGTWILPDERPLPAELVAFLDAGTPPVYVGFGSMRPSEDAARVDQPYWGGRVADLGIGTAHDGPTPTTESLSAALKTTLTSETRARATAVAGAIRTDGATVAATLLVDAVSRERPPVSA
jgi:vancomycin aglycone glucosyltransferase